MAIDTLHIVCLDQPYPPNYGGAIDMYYKIKALHRAGIHLILHIYLYHEAQSVPNIEIYADKTYYYRRHKSVQDFLSLTPFIIKTRVCEQLVLNLLMDDYPILFEGLHTCHPLSDKRLKGRFKMVRLHNVEHDYYRQLADYPNPLWRKLYYRVEAVKLQKYEKILSYADRILAISDADLDHYRQSFPKHDVRLLNCFFNDETTTSYKDVQPYVLYQGNLSVEENTKVVKYILSSIVPYISTEIHFIIAGRNPSTDIIKDAAQYSNVEVISNPDNKRMTQLVADAQINLLLTFQPTGIKLKLLNAVQQSKGQCIVNRFMLHGNKLGCLCIHADTAADVIKAITQNIATPLSLDDIVYRRQYIKDLGYNDIQNIIR